MTKYAVFDTETTALVSNSAKPLIHQPRVIEFYGIVYDDVSRKTSTPLEFKCDPGIPIPDEVSQITGITNDDIDGMPSFADMSGQVEAFFRAADAVVAHNLAYDKFVVDAEFRRDLGRPFDGWPKEQICTVEETEWIHGYRMNLGRLYEFLFNEEFDGAHRAENDVSALLRCFIELRQRGDI